MRVVVAELAEMVTVWADATLWVVTVKVACLVFAATVTVAGTLAALVLELDRLTTTPEGPALPFKFTVPVTVVDDPPITEAGDTVTDVTEAGSRVSVQVLDVEFRVAVMVVAVLELTPRVGTKNVVDVVPAGMVTVDGKFKLELPEPSEMTAPPVGAGPLMVTVPVG